MLLNKEQINKLIPQSPPFLLLDAVTDCTNELLVAEYQFSKDEYFFKGHFPGDPIVPGVLLCECCLQAGAVWMAMQSNHAIMGKAIVTKMDKVKFKNFLRPDESITIQVSPIEKIENFTLMKGKITNHDTIVMTMEFMVGVTK